MKYYIWKGGYNSDGKKPRLKETRLACDIKHAENYARETYGKYGWAEACIPTTTMQLKRRGYIK